MTYQLLVLTRRCYHSAPVLWTNLSSDLRCVVHHIIPSPIYMWRINRTLTRASPARSAILIDYYSPFYLISPRATL